MSESYGTGVPSTATPGTTGTVDTAKHEAAELKDTVTDQAKGVVATAKGEASSVVHEATSQAKSLFAQTQSELKDQASTQQQRVATGLQSISDELGSMASGSEQSGLAADLVRQASGRLAGAATWLSDRDPGSVLTEVKRFARRKPGTFILGAAVLGVVVGRLTRALATNAADEHADAANATVPARPVGDLSTPRVGVSTLDAREETPIFAQTSPEWADQRTEAGDDRRDTV